MSLTFRKCASAAEVSGASGSARLVVGMGASLSQTAHSSRSFRFRDVAIRLQPLASRYLHASTRRDEGYRAVAEAELMYLSSVRLDRKSRARSAGATSLIIERSRHPFHEKTDGRAVLMGRPE